MSKPALSQSWIHMGWGMWSQGVWISTFNGTVNLPNHMQFMLLICVNNILIRQRNISEPITKTTAKKYEDYMYLRIQHQKSNI